MTNDKETQSYLRLFNKMNKLFEREEITPLEAIPPLLIASAEAAIEANLSLADFTEILQGAVDHYVQRKKNGQ